MGGADLMATTSILGAAAAMLGNFQLGAVGTAAPDPPAPGRRQGHRPKPHSIDRDVYLGLRDRKAID